MNRLQQAIAASALGPPSKPDPETTVRSYRFDNDFPGFAGHFPGYPILPAIVQLLTVVSLASEQAGRQLRLASVEDAKFLTPVRPAQEVCVQYRCRIVGGRELYDARLTVAGTTAATFLIDLQEEIP